MMRNRVLVLLLAVAVAWAGPVAAHGDPGRAPGQLVSAEPVGDGWPGLSNAQRVTYLTTRANGDLVQAEAVVRLPSGKPPDGGWRTVAWDHGTSGLDHTCGYLDYEPLRTDNEPILRRLNEAGYAVVAPDYIGLSQDSPGPHPYLESDTEASATIDAVRAARAAFPQLSKSWAVAGYSQGGHAALATGHRAPEYSPELDFRGTVAMAPASNLETVFQRTRPGQPEVPGFAGQAVLMVLAGMPAAGLGGYTRDYLTYEGRNVVSQLTHGCGAATGKILSDPDIGDMVRRPLSDPGFVEILRDYMSVPTAGYQDPILLMHGYYDTVVPLPFTLTLVAQMALAGTEHNVRLLETGHDILRDEAGIEQMLTFLDRELPAR